MAVLDKGNVGVCTWLCCGCATMDIKWLRRKINYPAPAKWLKISWWVTWPRSGTRLKTLRLSFRFVSLLIPSSRFFSLLFASRFFSLLLASCFFFSPLASFRFFSLLVTSSRFSLLLSSLFSLLLASRFSLLLASRFFSLLFYFCLWQSRPVNGGVVGFPHGGFPYEPN